MTFMHTINEGDREILRRVVKTVHMKHYPKDFITNYEADKIISSIAPEVVDNLMKVGKDFNIQNI